ncbi:MAG TPA: asparagine synthase (glutamine-hydrolyzing) [Terriglobia bacterium]|nr:asparagine synthase (glutamine-hydrolyzing) [Terriglobia bacterium]
MCGIAGVLRSRGGAIDPAVLRRMANALAHRGPDGFGVYAKDEVGLAHARLSIIDVAGGHQPMSTPDGSVWITFNGEIFNYVELRSGLEKCGSSFATRSDTEVILRLYEKQGEECVHQMNGQWAFAIWDRRKRKLILSRDRVGVRPLFYAQTPTDLLFASEIKALFASGIGPHPRLDDQALDQIFTFWVTLPPRTAFEGVYQLPPGHTLIVQDGTTRIVQYWQPKYEPRECGDSSQAQSAQADELLNLLQDATKIRLRADVPVGAYLSGGLDSTVITALILRAQESRLRTFSVAFEDDEFDETPYQEKARHFLQTDHERVLCSRQQICDSFPSVVWHAEQPILRTAPAPMFQLSKCVHDSGFKAVLTGEGADEVFGGYDIFMEAKIRRYWGANLSSMRRPLLLRKIYPYMQRLQSQPMAYLKRFFRVTETDLQSPLFSHLPRWRLTAQLKTFFSVALRRRLQSYDSYEQMCSALPASYGGWPHLCQAQYLETAYLLPGYILSSQGDRMAMAHSVEARHPFLDHRVVEFASNLSPALKLKALRPKYLLKRASEGLVPRAIIERPKQPYRAPDGKSFFQQPASEYVMELVSPRRIDEDGIFDSKAVTALVNKFRAGRAAGVRDNMALVGILSTELLAHQFLHHVSPEGIYGTA